MPICFVSTRTGVGVKALLDLFGYADRDGDGWRDRPDGSPLLLEIASQSDGVSRQQQGLW